MRRILLSSTTAFAMSVCMASGGGVAEPVMEPEVVAAATSSSSGGIIVPLLLLLIIAAAVAGGGSDGTPAVSDARVKTDIEWVGMAKGFPIYQYRYIGTATRFEGVMAQDVANIRPDAVVIHSNGIMAVDYGKLGLKMRVVHWSGMGFHRTRNIGKRVRAPARGSDFRFRLNPSRFRCNVSIGCSGAVS